MNQRVSNENDLKVVEFCNTTDFDFTSDMGCMFDGRPIFGNAGVHGIKAGESVKLPYHVGHTLAKNLAKAVMVRKSPAEHKLDAQGNPMVASIWTQESLERLKKSFLTELYTEKKPVAMSETDKLMAKVEEYKKVVESLVERTTGGTKTEETTIDPTTVATTSAPVYQDKSEVIAELTKRGIKFDARQSKANLEKLLA